MKPWMIWLGAGIGGIGLAALLFPWVDVEPISDDGVEIPVSSESLDRRPPPRESTSTATSEPKSVSIETPDSENAPETVENQPVDVGGDSNDSPPGELTGRQERAERLKQPDMVAAMNLTSKWRALNYTVGQMEHDPIADNTMNRAKVLQQDLRKYRRDPSSFEFDELLARQQHIIGELKQTSYWGPELEQIADRMTRAETNYRSAN